MSIEWADSPIFGTARDAPTIRPSAYAIIVDSRRRIAVVRTPLGTFLPGGGIEPGEDVLEAIVREVSEECGLVIAVGAWSVRARQFVYAEAEKTQFEKWSTFVDARVMGKSRRSELDHALEWLPIENAIERFRDESHSWAVAEWRRATL